MAIRTLIRRVQMVWDVLLVLSKLDDKHLQSLISNVKELDRSPEAGPTRARLCVAEGATFLPEARVENLAGVPNRVRIGRGTFVRGELLTFRFGGTLDMGNDCYLGENSRIWAGEKVIIGNDVLISHDVFITDCNAHEIDPIERAATYRRIVGEGHPSEKGSVLTSPVTLEDHVWVNPHSVILPGVTIGRGTIVGCGSVVTKSLPPGVFAAGNPAKVIRSLALADAD